MQELRRIRRAKDITQEELGRQVGLTAAGISALERGDSKARQDTLINLADALDVTADELLGRHPKAAAPTSPPPAKDEERRYPYSWMGDDLARTIDRWEVASKGPNDPRSNYVIAVASLDIAGAILRYDVPGETLRDRVPEDEVDERLGVVKKLFALSQHAQEHYVDSGEAETDEVASVEQRRKSLQVLAGGAA